MGEARASHHALKAAKEQVYREHILDSGELVFSEFGFEKTQVKFVAKRAQVSLSTLYGHYSNKMELYRSVHARRLAQLMERLTVAAASRQEPLEQMLGAIEVYVGFHMEYPIYLKMHLREGNTWSQANGLFSPEQQVNWQRGLKRMAKTFKAGMDKGIFVKDDPVLLARTTNAMHQVALEQWVEKGMRAKPALVIGRLHHQFIRAFCMPNRVLKLLDDLGEYSS